MFSTKMNMDLTAIKDLGGVFGTVFADRFAFILIVDFSILAQGMWAMLRPLVSTRTYNKINFVGISKARQIVADKFAPSTCERINSAFDINRDSRSTVEEREE